jgi:multisubunit Na+/H+ antiporter MnhG subunit
MTHTSEAVDVVVVTVDVVVVTVGVVTVGVVVVTVGVVVLVEFETGAAFVVDVGVGPFAVAVLLLLLFLQTPDATHLLGAGTRQIDSPFVKRSSLKVPDKHFPRCRGKNFEHRSWVTIR